MQSAACSTVHTVTFPNPPSYLVEVPSSFSPMAALSGDDSGVGESMTLDSSKEEDDSDFTMAMDELHSDEDDSKSKSEKTSLPLQGNLPALPVAPSHDTHTIHSSSVAPSSASVLQPASPSHDTRITRSISPLSLGPVPQPVIPSYTQAMTLTKEELWHELQRMYEQNRALVQTTQIFTAQLSATNAHCTMTQQALAQSRLELENVKKKKQPRKSVKLRARFATYPKLEEDFNKVEEEQHAKDKADACHAQIERDTALKTFDALSTFRRKDDFITLAGALKLSRDGTVDELKTRIKEFLADTTKSQRFADDPRFVALFQAGSKARSKISATS